MNPPKRASSKKSDSGRPIAKLPKVALMWLVDADALGKHLTLDEVTEDDEVGGIVDGLEGGPHPVVDASVQIALNNNCAIVRGKANTACSLVMAGLASSSVDDGVLFVDGSQYAPIAMFHDRVYEATMGNVAGVLKGYDIVIGHLFEAGRLTGPKSGIGQFVLHLQNDMHVGGHSGDEMKAWRVAKKRDEG